MPRTHGLTYANGKRTALHMLWLNIRNRCNNPRGQDYKHYGARGIQVCARWNSFAIFAADVGPHPGAGLTLDRIETDKDYEPGNVRWATRQTQARNRPYCILDRNKAEDIRKMYAAGNTQVKLAQQFGVTQASISQIVRGVSWR